MFLALKRTPARSATRVQRIFAALTKWRLCSQYSHGGIVIGGTLYHSTVQHHGLQSEAFDMSTAGSGWDFFDLGDALDAHALQEFEKRRGSPYDWFGLLAFVIPLEMRPNQRLYCFEWCALALGLEPDGRVVPEDLLVKAIQSGKISEKTD